MNKIIFIVALVLFSTSAYAIFNDQGLEVIRRAAEPQTSGSKVEAVIKTRTIDDQGNVINYSNSFPVTVTASALPLGASTAARQDITNLRIGDLTESVPANDTASSGLNGRLQRIAQSLTSILETQSDGTQESRILDGSGNRITSQAFGTAGRRAIEVIQSGRIDQFSNRVSIHKSIENTSLSATPSVIHTVTSGKTFWLVMVHISCLNGANAVGQWRIQNGSSSDIKFTYLMAEKAIGSPSAAIETIVNIEDPVEFTTTLEAVEQAGDITCSINIHGYEEPN